MAGESLDRIGANGAGNGADWGAHGTAVIAVAPRRAPAIDLDPAQRAEARRLVEETVLSMRAIAARLGVPQASFARFAAEQGWTRPAGAPRAVGGMRQGQRRLAATIADAGTVMARMLRATDRQVAKIETRLRKRGATIEEKDARILGHLARTLATLMTLDKDGGSANEPEPVDRAELNAELVRRITRWAEGEEEPA